MKARISTVETAANGRRTVKLTDRGWKLLRELAALTDEKQYEVVERLVERELTAIRNGK